MTTSIFRLPSNYTALVRNQLHEQSTGSVAGHFFGHEVWQFIASETFLSAPEFKHLALIGFDKPVSTEEVEDYYSTMGLLPATAKELIALYLDKPEFAVGRYIVALGQQNTLQGACVKIPSVPAYWRWAHQSAGWHFQVHQFNKWETLWQFAAVFPVS